MSNRMANNEALAEIERTNGPVNFFRALSQRPEAMTHFAAFYRTVMGTGSLERRLKEMIYLAVSCVNECDYCEAHHARTASAAGVSEGEIDDVSNETDQNFPPNERLALQFARELTRTASVESDLRYQVERQFSADQVVELTLVASLANFTNRFNNGLAIPLEHERTQTAT
jgi:uncharacterized peroxidase-related enzyme